MCRVEDFYDSTTRSRTKARAARRLGLSIIKKGYSHHRHQHHQRRRYRRCPGHLAYKNGLIRLVLLLFYFFGNYLILWSRHCGEEGEFSTFAERPPGRYGFSVGCSSNHMFRVVELVWCFSFSILFCHHEKIYEGKFIFPGRRESK